MKEDVLLGRRPTRANRLRRGNPQELCLSATAMLGGLPAQWSAHILKDFYQRLWIPPLLRANCAWRRRNRDVCVEADRVFIPVAVFVDAEGEDIAGVEEKAREIEILSATGSIGKLRRRSEELATVNQGSSGTPIRRCLWDRWQGSRKIQRCCNTPRPAPSIERLCPGRHLAPGGQAERQAERVPDFHETSFVLY